MLPGCTPWPAELALSYRAKGYWGDVSIPRVFNEMAAEAPDRIVVIEGGARTTLAGLWNDSGRLAAHFHRIGLFFEVAKYICGYVMFDQFTLFERTNRPPARSALKRQGPSYQARGRHDK